jgi:putative hydrolase of the HAD superfamily
MLHSGKSTPFLKFNLLKQQFTSKNRFIRNLAVSIQPRFMRQYQHLFFDLDHTLWDFDTNSKQTLSTLYQTLHLKEKGVTDIESMHRQYTLHNDRLWERYRNGQIKQDELRWKRMWFTLLDFKIGDEALAKTMSAQFLNLLPTRNALFPYTIEILEYLQQKGYQLHLITNGFEEVQHNKIKYAGLDPYFDKVITSEGSNSLKPHKGIFEYALQQTGASLTESIMLGDNFEADIQGAMNMGMDQVFINHLKEIPPVTPTYMVYTLKELEEIF